MDRLDGILDRMGNGVNDSQVLNNLKSFIQTTSDIGGGDGRQEQAWAITYDLLNRLSNTYNNNNCNN